METNVIETLVARGATKREARIASVKVNDDDVVLILNKKVEGMVLDEENNYVKGLRKSIHISLFSLKALLQENQDTTVVVDTLLAKPTFLKIVLAGASVVLFCEEVEAGEYQSPFSDTVRVLENDTILHHVVEVNLSPMGKAAVKTAVTAYLQSVVEDDLLNEEE